MMLFAASPCAKARRLDTDMTGSGRGTRDLLDTAVRSDLHSVGASFGMPRGRMLGERLVRMRPTCVLKPRSHVGGVGGLDARPWQHSARGAVTHRRTKPTASERHPHCSKNTCSRSSSKDGILIRLQALRLSSEIPDSSCSPCPSALTSLLHMVPKKPRLVDPKLRGSQASCC